MTTQEQLNSVQAAITAIETGAQEYYVGQRRVRKADLNILYKERERLERKLNFEQNGGITYWGSIS